MSDDADTRIAQLRQEEPEWGILPAAMRFKQDIVRSHGLEDALPICSKALDVPHLTALRRRPVRSMLEAARTSASSFTELWEGGEPFSAPPTRIIGDNDHGPFSGVSRSNYLACFHDCVVRGRSAVVYHDGAVLVDFEGQERAHLRDNPEYDPGVLLAEPDHFWTMEPRDGDDIPVVEEAFMLSGSHTKDFGHWVTEYLPKVATASLAGLPPMPVLVDEKNPKTLKQSLDIFLPGRTGTIEIPHLAPVRVKRLWVASNPVFMGFYPTVWDRPTWMSMATPPKGIARLFAELRRLGGFDDMAPTGIGKLYLGRKASRQKKLLENHDAVEALMRRHGFTVVYPEDLRFIDQLRHVYQAPHIAGPEGSNMLLPLFGRPGAKVLTLTSPNTYPLSDINTIYRSIGMDYTLFTGPYTKRDDDAWLFWSNYRVDTEALDGFLADWTATAKSA